MNIDKIIVRHSALTNGTAGLLISVITCSETAVPIRIGSISLYIKDCMFGEDGAGLQSGARLTPWCRNAPCGKLISVPLQSDRLPYASTVKRPNVCKRHWCQTN